jgi:hypothetical protein
MLERARADAASVIPLRPPRRANSRSVSRRVQSDAPEDDLRLVNNKSPKGTGKTEYLRGILANYPSVLLVGHRRALIRQSCTRLNLACYLELGEARLARGPPSASTASRDCRTATG